MTARRGAVLLPLAAACTAAGPTIDPIDDQVVAVGDELSIEIRATTGDTGGVRFDFASNAPDLGDRAGLARRPDGSALFRWQPSAEDVGTWLFDFTASDGAGSSTETVQIEVRSTIGANSIPLFRRPLGAGVAIDEAEGCVEVAVETTDQDSSEVAIAEVEPLIEGGELLQDGAMSASWRWCPTSEQRALKDRYLLTLSADDGDNPAAIKRYQIILREQRKSECAGVEPVIEHVAADRHTLNDLEVVARVHDDRGLKAAPLLYYAAASGPEAPDVRDMIQAQMRLEIGDLREGTWRGAIPNPVGREAPGTSQAIRYVLIAEDDDDALDDCDHMAARAFEMEVTNPGGDGGLGACSPCTADNQCGGAADHCLRLGVEGEAFCMTGCTTDDQCGEGTVCSRGELESIEGARGRQCVPIDEQCEATARCRNDALERNDSAASAQPLPPGTTGDLTLCPIGDFGGEEDWYRIELADDAEVAIALAGASEPDMDLLLMRDGGPWVAMSGESGSQDRIAQCLPGGSYLLRVDSLFAGQNRYALTWSASPSSCAWSASCVDDRNEDDDDLGAARHADLGAGPWTSPDNSICSDDDWFEVQLDAGQTLYAALEFQVGGPGQDLDFHVHDASGTDLTPCTVEAPWECSANGQSGGAGEHIQFTAEAADTYYLVVRGWDGSRNAYDLCASLSAAACPQE